MAPKILLHGSGAIGSAYVYLLSKHGVDVTAVCRSNYDVAKANGFHLDSAIYGENLHARPNVVRTPADATGPFEYILVCTKSVPEAQTSKVIAPAVTPGKTTIVLIQNGVGIEDEYAKAFPENPLLSCVVYLPATQIRPGYIQMGNVEALEIGTYPQAAYENSNTRAATDGFVKMMKSAGSNAAFFPDVQEQRWKKLLLNAAWNPICALTLSRDVAFLASSPMATDAVMAVMAEIVAIAQACGYTSITEEAARSQLQRATDRIGGKGIEPSMLVDALTERRMEVETLLGNPIAVAKAKGISVPRLETLYVLLKALDESLAFREGPGMSLGGDETRQAREAAGPSGEL